ncbi:hypothetical protein [Anaerocaecibacter muris]|uniref:hypothetical protein n=1 Tax=Anaerocaecibacter muris TaxID=2941513 RepID=UPI00203EDCE2|nr:hypothetical protein [Anaerocaecibacter muris]MCX4312853.1 hypothetical protein [Clostridia bacterium]
MIDIENAVYTKVYNALKAEFPSLTVTGDPVAAPSEFPCASIYEADNYSYEKTQDSGGNENHARVMYEVYVFSNKKSGHKTECKNIFKVADDVLLSLGFTRKSRTPVNDVGSGVYCLIGRYAAVVSTEKKLYRR